MQQSGLQSLTARTRPSTKVSHRTPGYCYLVWFDHYRSTKLQSVAHCLGPYPYIRDVLVTMLCHGFNDVLIYDVVQVRDGLLHVNSDHFVHFSDLLDKYLFTLYHIGSEAYPPPLYPFPPPPLPPSPSILTPSLSNFNAASSSIPLSPSPAAIPRPSSQLLNHRFTYDSSSSSSSDCNTPIKHRRNHRRQSPTGPSNRQLAALKPNSKPTTASNPEEALQADTLVHEYSLVKLLDQAEIDVTTIQKNFAANTVDLIAKYHPEKIAKVIFPNQEKPQLTLQYSKTTSSTEVDLLKAAYPGFRFVVSSELTQNSHELNAVARRAETVRIYDRYGIFTPARERDSLILSDIGGNTQYCARKNLCKIHVCNTILDLKDGARKTSTQIELSLAVANGTVTKSAARRFSLTQPTRFVCLDGAQNCGVVTPVACEIHVYDISMRDRCQYLDKKQVDILHQIVHFSPLMLIQESGVLQPADVVWSKFTENDVQYIKFSFRGQCTNSYVHTWDDYIAPFIMKTIVTPAGRLYHIEINPPRISQYEIVYTRVVGTFDPRVEFRMYHEFTADTEDFMAVPFFQKNATLYIPNTSNVNLYYRYVLVRRDFVNLAIRTAMTNVGRPNRVKNILDVLNSYNVRKTIDGIEFQNRHVYDSSVLLSLAVYADAYVYVDFYSHMKALETVTELSVESTKYQELTVFSYMRYGTELGRAVDEYLSKAGRTAAEYAESMADQRLRAHGLPSLNDFRSEVTIEIERRLRIRISEQISHLIAITPVTANYSAPDTISRAMKHRPVRREQLVSKNTSRSYRRNTENSIIKVNPPNVNSLLQALRYPKPKHGIQLPESAVFRPIAPDGCCLYNALLIATGAEYRPIGNYYSPLFHHDALRALMYNVLANLRNNVPVAWLSESEASLLVDIFSPDGKHDDVAALLQPVNIDKVCTWASYSHIHLFSLMFRVNIYSYVNVLHQQTERAASVPLSEPANAVGNIFLHMPIHKNSTTTHADAWEILPNLGRSITRLFFERVRSVKDNDDYVHAPDQLRQRTKFRSLVTSLPVEGDVLELGFAPGCWTHELMTLNPKSLTVVTLPEGLPIDSSVLAYEARPEFLMIESDAESFLQVTESQFDTIISDIATADSWDDITSQVHIFSTSVSRLRPSGSIAFKFSNVFSPDLLPSVTPIASSFRSAFFLKPEGSRLRSTEVYLVCLGYGESNSTNVTSLASTRIAIIERILEFCSLVLTGRTPKPRLPSLRIGGLPSGPLDFGSALACAIAGTFPITGPFHASFVQKALSYHTCSSVLKAERLNALEKFYIEMVLNETLPTPKPPIETVGYLTELKVSKVFQTKTSKIPVSSSVLHEATDYAVATKTLPPAPSVPQTPSGCTSDDDSGYSQSGYTPASLSEVDEPAHLLLSEDSSSFVDASERSDSSSSLRRLLSPSSSKENLINSTASTSSPRGTKSSASTESTLIETLTVSDVLSTSVATPKPVTSTMLDLSSFITSLKRHPRAETRATWVNYADFAKDLDSMMSSPLRTGLFAYSLTILFTSRHRYSSNFSTGLSIRKLIKRNPNEYTSVLQTGQHFFSLQSNNKHTTSVVLVDVTTPGWSASLSQLLLTVSNHAGNGYRYKVLLDVLPSQHIMTVLGTLLGKTGLQYRFLVHSPTLSSLEPYKTHIALYEAEIPNQPVPQRQVFETRLKATDGPIIPPKSVNTLSEVAVLAAAEFRSIQTKIRDTLVPRLREVLHCFETNCNIQELLRLGYNYYDLQEKRPVYTDPWNRSYVDYFYVWNGRFIKYDVEKAEFPHSSGEPRYAVYCRDTELMLDEKVLAVIDSLKVTSASMPAFYWLNGPPGCGKTTLLKEHFDHQTDIILSATRAGSAEISSKISDKLTNAPYNISKKDANRIVKNQVRTIASLLINSTGHSPIRAFVDEATMVHGGMVVYAVSRIPSITQVIMVGDMNQIPYVDRYHIGKLQYCRPHLISSPLPSLNVTYRCPMDVVYALRELYPNFYTTSEVEQSLTLSDFSSFPYQEDTLYLTFTHAEKTQFAKKIPKSSSIMTVAESQGLTRKHVIVLRDQVNELQIYSDVKQATTAISRHTHTFKYVTKKKNDALSKFMIPAIQKHCEDGYLTSFNAQQKTQATPQISETLAKLGLHIGIGGPAVPVCAIAEEDVRVNFLSCRSTEDISPSLTPTSSFKTSRTLSDTGSQPSARSVGTHATSTDNFSSQRISTTASTYDYHSANLDALMSPKDLLSSNLNRLVMTSRATESQPNSATPSNRSLLRRLCDAKWW
nr:TPA_asm: large ORF [Aedes binegev-like virus 2]